MQSALSPFAYRAWCDPRGSHERRHCGVGFLGRHSHHPKQNIIGPPPFLSHSETLHDVRANPSRPMAAEARALVAEGARRPCSSRVHCNVPPAVGTGAADFTCVPPTFPRVIFAFLGVSFAFLLRSLAIREWLRPFALRWRGAYWKLSFAIVLVVRW